MDMFEASMFWLAYLLSAPGILCRPFLSATDTSQPAAARHLRLLLSFCHSKQHSGAAIALLTQVIKHVHVTEHQLRASVSILAAIADAIGGSQTVLASLLLLHANIVLPGSSA